MRGESQGGEVAVFSWEFFQWNFFMRIFHGYGGRVDGDNGSIKCKRIKYGKQ